MSLVKKFDVDLEFGEVQTVCLVGPYGSGRYEFTKNISVVCDATPYFRENLYDWQMDNFFSREVQIELLKLQRRQILELKEVCDSVDKVVSDIHPFGVYRLFNILMSGSELAYARILNAFENASKSINFGFMIIDDKDLEHILEKRNRSNDFIERVLSYNGKFLSVYESLVAVRTNVFKVDTSKVDIYDIEDVSKFVLEHKNSFFN